MIKRVVGAGAAIALAVSVFLVPQAGADECDDGPCGFPWPPCKVECESPSPTDDGPHWSPSPTGSPNGTGTPSPTEPGEPTPTGPDSPTPIDDGPSPTSPGDGPSPTRPRHMHKESGHHHDDKDQLAATGSATGPLLGVSAVLLVAGGSVVYAARRRHGSHE